MRLTETQSRELLRTHSVYAKEACDRCGKVLGRIRYTRRDEPGEWCSRWCRDGVDRKPGACESCGTTLEAKRKGARFCSDVCRKRRRVHDIPNIPERPIADKGLTDAIWRSA